MVFLLKNPTYPEGPKEIKPYSLQLMLTSCLLTRTRVMSAPSHQYYPRGKIPGTIEHVADKAIPNLDMDEKKEWLRWKREDNATRGELMGVLRQPIPSPRENRSPWVSRNMWMTNG